VAAEGEHCEGFDRPSNNMERVGTPDRIRCASYRNNDHIPVSTFVGDLVDPDPTQPSRRSTVVSMSLLTRVVIDPMVRHATRNS
jgi:hypothetical protein